MMIRFCVRQMQAIGIAAAAILGLAASEMLIGASSDTAPNVTYTATGVFTSSPISGTDPFELADEPFSIGVVANAATVPTTNGAQWARYTKLKLTGTVSTGLVANPFLISSADTSIELATGNPNYDLFEMFAPVTVVGLQIDVLANIQLPPGTMANAHVHPFVSIALGPTDTVKYWNASTGDSTTLGIASGTLVGTIPSKNQ